MSAIVEPVSSSQDALPVCLGGENPHRLVSLWDIVKEFAMAGFIARLEQLSAIETQCSKQRESGAGGMIVDDNLFDNAVSIFLGSHELCESIGFGDAAGKLQRSAVVVDTRRGAIDFSSLESEVRNATESIWADMVKQKFIQINADVSDYFLASWPFGRAVHNRFPSALGDARAASNCIAVGLPTAAVFHLMRAAEYGALRENS